MPLFIMNRVVDLSFGADTITRAASASFTTSRELHPAPKNYLYVFCNRIPLKYGKIKRFLNLFGINVFVITVFLKPLHRFLVLSDSHNMFCNSCSPLNNTSFNEILLQFSLMSYQFPDYLLLNLPNIVRNNKHPSQYLLL